MGRRAGGAVRLIGLLALGLFGLVHLASGAAHGAGPDLQALPDKVEIGAFFQGTWISVQGRIPQGAQAVVEVMGEPATESLLRKGRRGFLWMNVGEVQAHQAPSLYLAAASDPTMLSSRESDDPWGYRALKRQITFSGHLKEGEETLLFKEFLQLKESEGLYDASPNPIQVRPRRQGPPVAAANLWLPAKVAPGTYQVCLWVVQDGRVVEKRLAELSVVKAGFPAFLSALAYEHGAIYGLLAVGIALATGFAMGFIFKGGGGH